MLTQINTTDIPDAIRLGCETMQRIFNADDDHMPHFRARAWPPDQVHLGFLSPYTEAHVPGRHLLALLEAQDAIGVTVDDHAIDNHRRALLFSLDNPLTVPLNRVELGARPTIFDDHNMREALHGLYALARFRDDAQARELADAMIETVFELWRPSDGWNIPRLTDAGISLRRQAFITGPARSIGPLVRYHRATGSGRAVELALLLAQKAAAEFFTPEGEFDAARFGTHTHSTTCTLSGLAQLADLVRDADLMQSVRAFYDIGLNQFRDPLGWVWEHSGADWVNPDRGEGNNTGDIIETALLLGRWGWPHYFGDAERMLRCHLLPSQLRDISFIPRQAASDDRGDGKRDAAERMRGAWGFPAPYGHRPIGIDVVDFCLDIVGGVVSSLCEAWRAAATRDPAGHRVNMLFDRDDAGLKVESPYTHDALRVTPRQPGPLWVRLPRWVDRSTLVVESHGAAHRFTDDFLCVPTPVTNAAITARFELPASEVVLQHSTRTIRVALRGDSVTAMDGFGDDLTFFPEFEASM